jgi:hypothetical protein
MKLRGWGIALAAFAGSCQPTPSSVAEEHIPDSVLVPLLVDLHLYESALQTRGGSLDQFPTPATAAFIGKKYGYTQEEVQKELEGLIENSERGDTVMAQTVRKLKALQQALPAPETPAIGIVDRRTDAAAALLPTEPVRPKLPERRGSGGTSSLQRIRQIKEIQKSDPAHQDPSKDPLEQPLQDPRAHAPGN